jgi:hypothetical protein
MQAPSGQKCCSRNQPAHRIGQSALARLVTHPTSSLVVPLVNVLVVLRVAQLFTTFYHVSFYLYRSMLGLVYVGVPVRRDRVANVAGLPTIRIRACGAWRVAVLAGNEVALSFDVHGSCRRNRSGWHRRNVAIGQKLAVLIDDAATSLEHSRVACCRLKRSVDLLQLLDDVLLMQLKGACVVAALQIVNHQPVNGSCVVVGLAIRIKIALLQVVQWQRDQQLHLLGCGIVVGSMHDAVL